MNEFMEMMTHLGSPMDATSARAIMFRDTEPEVTFEGFCNIVKAAAERTQKKMSPPEPPLESRRIVPKGQVEEVSKGLLSLNAAVLEKYKRSHVVSS